MSVTKRSILLLLLVLFRAEAMPGQNRVENKTLADYYSIMEEIASAKLPAFFGDLNAPEWILLATVRPPFDESELVLGLAKFSSGSGRLVLLKPHPTSILAQVRVWKNENRAKMISMIKFSSRVTDAEKCTRLVEIIARWEDFNIPLVPKSALMLDATGYDLEFRSLNGGKRRITVEGGNFGTDRSPIIRLLHETATACP